MTQPHHTIRQVARLAAPAEGDGGIGCGAGDHFFDWR